MGKWFELYWNIEATKNKANQGQQVEDYGWKKYLEQQIWTQFIEFYYVKRFSFFQSKGILNICHMVL